MIFVCAVSVHYQNNLVMKKTFLQTLKMSSILTLIERDDGQKKQTLEKMPSVAIV